MGFDLASHYVLGKADCDVVLSDEVLKLCVLGLPLAAQFFGRQVDRLAQFHLLN